MGNQQQREAYEYQQEGIEFLIKHGSGAIWDEPGLGKTMQAACAAKRLGSPVLIVCPSMLRRWWRKEIIALFPEDWNSIQTAVTGGRIERIRQGQRTEIKIHYVHQRCQRNGHDFPRWTICHYTGLRICKDSYAQIPWKTVILDEAHYIKNAKTLRSKAAVEVTPPLAYRIMLTATPFGNLPADLWHQLRWLAPEVAGLASYWRFYNIFVDYKWEKLPSGRRIRKVNGGKNLDLLAKLMSYYGLQRTKKVVAPQLPPLVETELPLELTGRQQTVYEALADKARVELVIRHTATNGGELAQVQHPTLTASKGRDAGGCEEQTSDKPAFTGLIIKNALSRLTKMEHWLSAPWLFDPIIVGTKFDWIKEWAKSYREPAVIATRFRSAAQRIHEELGPSKAGLRAIDGSVPYKLRVPVLERWQANDADSPQFLVGTINTLGTGLNLDRAHTLVCYDQVWSPILMDQVRQRIHRITTDHPVQVVYLYIEGTSNEVVLQAVKRKWRDIELVRHFLMLLQAGRK